MMKILLKKMMLFYVALALVGTPVELLAAQKKPHKRIQASQKNALTTHRIASRYKASRLKVMLRSRAVRQLHRRSEQVARGAETRTRRRDS